MQSCMSRRFYQEILPGRGCYDVRHNGEKGVSEGRVRVFPCREFFLDKGLHSCIIAPPTWLFLLDVVLPDGKECCELA